MCSNEFFILKFEDIAYYLLIQQTCTGTYLYIIKMYYRMLIYVHLEFSLQLCIDSFMQEVRPGHI